MLVNEIRTLTGEAIYNKIFSKYTFEEKRIIKYAIGEVKRSAKRGVSVWALPGMLFPNHHKMILDYFKLEGFDVNFLYETISW